MFLYDLMSFSVIDDFANEAFLQGLISLLEEDQVSNLEEWPTSLGGGEVISMLFRFASPLCLEIS